MHSDALRFVIMHPLAVAADALVVEDNNWLAGANSLAAEVDARGGELLRAERAALVAAQGPLRMGEAVATGSGEWATRGGPPVIVHTVTYTYPERNRTSATRLGATPLDVGRATAAALAQAVGRGARHVVFQPLGIRPGHHRLPPVPKTLVRYVMAAVQLQAIDRALQKGQIDQVTIALTDRGFAIWNEVLGNDATTQGEM